MKKLKIIVLAALLAVSVILLFMYQDIESVNYVEQGVVHLDNTPLQDDGVISLDGEWIFYGNQLLAPDDITMGNSSDASVYSVPGKWKQGMIDGDAMGPRGFGTYRLVIHDVTPHMSYGLIKKNIRIASAVYVDGALLMEDGRPAAAEANEVMGNAPWVVTFSPQSSTVEIIIQVSNFKYYSGGIVETIRFGYAQDIIRESSRNIIFETIIFAMVIAIGVMYGILALMLPRATRQDRASILLPFAVIMFAVVNGALSERIMLHIFPALSTEGLIRIEYVAAALLFMSMFSAIRFMERKLLPALPHWIIQGIFALLMVASIFAPMKYPITWTIFTYANVVTLAFGFLFVLLKYLIRDKMGLCVQEHTFIMILLYTMNVYNFDVYMFTFSHKSNMNIAMISTAFYGMTWLAWILYRYIVAHRENEQLSRQLLENHYAMERTSRNARCSEMAFLQAQIKPHFLFNSLSSILSLQRISPQRAERMLQSLSEYLKDLFDVDISAEYIHIENELHIVQAYVNIEKERFSDRLDVVFDIDEDVVSCKIIPLLIQPLVENALRHGALKREADGRVVLSIQRDHDAIQVMVQDNGPGFSEMALAAAQRKTSSNDRRGIGVGNIRHRLRYYYDEALHIENLQEGGVRLSFRVPIMGEEDECAENSDR